MLHVAFIAPRFLENTNRYLRAFSEVAARERVRLSVISADPESSIPPPFRPGITGHYRIDDCMDPAQLLVAARAIVRSLGPIDRLAGVLEQLQLPMAEVRSRYYLRFTVADRPGVLGQLTTILGAHDVSIAQVVQDERGAGSAPAQVVIVTHDAAEGDVQAALATITALPINLAPPRLIRVLA